MRNSILFHLSDKNKNPGLPKKEKIPEEFTKIYYKKYPRLAKIILPEPNFLYMSLSRTLSGRESERNFDAGKPISLQEISDFLYWSAGVKEKEKIDSKRMYPSGGARFPVEIYPVVFRGEGIENGIYHYSFLDHSLEKLADETWAKEAVGMLTQKEMKEAPVIFLMTAVFERTMMKYNEFGYRLILQETGHICQNFYLTATAMGLGGCGLGGFDNVLANKLLDTDGVNEASSYAFALGRTLSEENDNQLKKNKEPIQFVDWLSKEKCNYKCSYCFASSGQNKNLVRNECEEFPNAELFLPKFKKVFPGEWIFNFGSTEPFMIPNFLEIVGKLVKMGYRININTNFSFPLETILKFCKTTGNNLNIFKASLHLEQANAGEFLHKAKKLNLS